jgi:glycosyltransferase involved in cell wall biosynthesis
MPARPRVCICGAQVPFSTGGAELLVASLREELERRGFEVELVLLPFSWSSRTRILDSALAWRLLDLSAAGERPIDLVIATRFPSYVVRHPNKVVWLIHQFRQVYELEGTPYSDFGSLPDDEEVVGMIRRMDRRTLAEARRLCTISRNTAQRLDRYLGLSGEAVYPPPALADRLRQGEFGDYLLSVGRLDAMKRFDQLLAGLAASSGATRCVLVGDGPERGRLEAQARELGIAGRVEFAGRVDDERLIELYAGALAVFYAPFDEDYGYVTVEAFRAGKPVITTDDAGGVLEFVRDGRNGLVCAPGARRQIGRAIDRLADDRDLARSLGAAGRRDVEAVTWDRVIETLTATL